jgi:ParB-like chromosome segregation protein Spo0J
MSVTRIPIDLIAVGDRDRIDFGGLDSLANSLEAVGMLHPVVVTEDHRLIAGQRRIAAAVSLGWTTVPIVVAGISTVEELLRAEADENECRKALSPLEAARARERRAKVLAPLAEEREKAGRPSPKLGEGDPRTAKLAAAGTGYSGSTLDKIDVIREAAEEGTATVKRGRKRERVDLPEPAREVARQQVEKLQEPGALVEPAHKAMQDALDAYIDTSSDVKHAKAQAALAHDLAPGRSWTFLQWQPEDAAALMDEDEISLFDSSLALAQGWITSLRKARGPALRVIGKD